ncbi:uncharacterized protein [Nicotiana sylvestris]|uniref:Uncharacterized protein LOC104236693 isoform X6 n=1 Tax=Nicotiana sylvestris TaxID=4096 RepID=A0A1U7XQ34_NICSY|nr:PREDICTED: uncharacterized protein LOC104236693 isoform X6 [Nicotiana sylvestris]
MAHYLDSSSSLVPPLIAKPSKVDLEAGNVDHIQCRICLESDGMDFIAPCKCKGTSKYVHRECLDQWRAVKEGFAFAHCTTCEAPFYLRVNDLHRKWRTLKFRFFVTTDILVIFLAVQLVIASLGYLVYVIDTHQKSWLLLHWGFDCELCFYYICECVQTVIRIVQVQLISASILTYAPKIVRIRHVNVAPRINLAQNVNVGIALEVKRIWQRRYHILEKRILTKDKLHHKIKEYVVEDVGEVARNDWSPPPLPQEHVQQLESLGLL